MVDPDELTHDQLADGLVEAFVLTSAANPQEGDTTEGLEAICDLIKALVGLDAAGLELSAAWDVGFQVQHILDNPHMLEPHLENLRSEVVYQ